MMNAIEPLIIVGGGPAGLLTAYYLARRVDKLGAKLYPNIKIIERESDLRNVDPIERRGRGNYSLVLSYRGCKALEKVGLKKDLLELGQTYYNMQLCLGNDNLPTGMLYHSDFAKVSIDRDDVVRMLLKAIDRDCSSQVEIVYEMVCSQVDFNTKQVYLIPSKLKNTAWAEITKDDVTVQKFGILIGADGAHSKVVSSLRQQVFGIEFKQTFAKEPFFSVRIPYKEFKAINMDVEKATMYVVQSAKRNANLIIVPEHDGLGIAFIPQCFKDQHLEGDCNDPDQQCFHTFKTKKQFEAYLIATFPKLGPLLYKSITPILFPDGVNLKLPRLFYVGAEISQYHHPTLPAIVMGDAVHAMPPYVGQGINAAFEDIQALDSILDSCDDDWDLVPKIFTEQRLPQGKAIKTLNQLYEQQNLSLFAWYRLILDHVRNSIHRRLGDKFIQPSVNQLLTQSDTQYKHILNIRDQHLYSGTTTLFLMTLFFAITMLFIFRIAISNTIRI